MCGRFALAAPPAALIAHFGLDHCASFAPRYNIAPTAQVPVIRLAPEGKRVADLLKWGLVPHWAKDPAIGNRLINARAETVAEKPAFRSAWKRRRCLIPASGYYEWQTVPGARKQPWYVRLKHDELMALAGLWESWTSPEGDILRSFCVITTSANDILQPIHERMPAIIGREHWTDWLDPGHADVAALLAPSAAAEMQAWPVSRRVSSAGEEGAGLIEAV